MQRSLDCSPFPITITETSLAPSLATHWVVALVALARPSLPVAPSSVASLSIAMTLFQLSQMQPETNHNIYIFRTIGMPVNPESDTNTSLCETTSCFSSHLFLPETSIEIEPYGPRLRTSNGWEVLIDVLCTPRTMHQKVYNLKKLLETFWLKWHFELKISTFSSSSGS